MEDVEPYTQDAAEKSVYDLLPEILGVDDPVIIEIGAAGGEDTARIVNLLTLEQPDTHFQYLAFEPEPRNIATFRCFGFPSHVKLIEACVGNIDGFVDFYRSGGIYPGATSEHTYSGSVKHPVEHTKVFPWCTFNETMRVRMVRLDTEIPRKLSRDGLIDFIWCDCQGAEDLVLAGGIATFARTRYFYTEFYDIEMYDGQLPLSGILERLPRWEVVDVFSSGNEDNALLKNTALP